jgi:hypothetical protein
MLHESGGMRAQSRTLARWLMRWNRFGTLDVLKLRFFGETPKNNRETRVLQY